MGRKMAVSHPVDKRRRCADGDRRNVAVAAEAARTSRSVAAAQLPGILHGRMPQSRHPAGAAARLLWAW